MAKQRYINTKFWSDNFISKLKPIERYLFLYFLTNEHTNISGIYELPIRTVCFETGLKEKIIRDLLAKFSQEGKIFEIEGWVYVKNFAKHQCVNEKTRIGIENMLSEVAPNVLAQIKEINIKYNTQVIGYDTQAVGFELSKFKSKLKSKLKCESDTPSKNDTLSDKLIK